MLEPLDLSVAAAGAALRAGRLRVVELTEACLERARATEPLGAFALLDAAGALDQAAALDRELAECGPRGPLHGLPVAVKDLLDVAGLPTRGGSAVPDGLPARRDATLVARARAAGAVIVGKSATHELAFGVTTPAAANPWAPERSPGGSSGGSAVAVATGASLGALGTDTAGSIRLPAALCGVSGLKARPRSLPMDGVIALAPSMDSAGPLARSAEDLGLLWASLGGDPEPAQLSVLRVGVPEPAPSVDGEVATAFQTALGTLARAGARVVSVRVPPWEAWGRPRGRLLVAEALAAHRAAGWYPSRAQRYGSEVLGYLRAAERLSAEDVQAARRELADLAGRLRAALAAVDVLALPTCPLPAPARDADPVRAAHELTVLCGPANGAQLAAASVPCGFTAAGLPIGLQLMAGHESLALAAARRYQSLTDFHQRHPPTAGDAEREPALAGAYDGAGDER